MASPTKQPSDPLAEAMRENQELRSALAKSGQQFQQLLYAASHDLQEPLRGIVTYAQLLDRQFAADPQVHEYTSFVLGGALRMRELLQRLLTYSRAGASQKHLVVNLNVPLQMALLKLAPEIQAAGAEIERGSLPEVTADENEMALLFEELLANSLKFRSKATPHIVIASEQGSDEHTITVSDNGLGIDPGFCEQALLPFKRLHSSSAPGSGLGLAICHKIVMAHQGQLRVESDGEHGVAIVLTLPN